MLGAMSSNTPLPAGNYSPTWSTGNRPKPPLVAGELELLTSYLDYYRATIELKCAGVPRERLSETVIPPSTLTLHGLVRHLAGAEGGMVAALLLRRRPQPGLR